MLLGPPSVIYVSSSSSSASSSSTATAAAAAAAATATAPSSPSSSSSPPPTLLESVQWPSAFAQQFWAMVSPASLRMAPLADPDSRTAALPLWTPLFHAPMSIIRGQGGAFSSTAAVSAVVAPSPDGGRAVSHTLTSSVAVVPHALLRHVGLRHQHEHHTQPPHQPVPPPPQASGHGAASDLEPGGTLPTKQQMMEFFFLVTFFFSKSAQSRDAGGRIANDKTETNGFCRDRPSSRISSHRSCRPMHLV